MRTHPVFTDDGSRAPAFQIESIYMGLKDLRRLLSQIPGASDVRLSTASGPQSDVRIEFSYCGNQFMAWEPFGDNSRYWIGPKQDPTAPVNIAALESAFEGYRPPLHRLIVGDLLTLRFVTRLFPTRGSP